VKAFNFFSNEKLRQTAFQETPIMRRPCAPLSAVMSAATVADIARYQANRAPDAIALSFEGRQTTFGALFASSSALPSIKRRFCELLGDVPKSRGRCRIAGLGHDEGRRRGASLTPSGSGK
jgi:hypothetical protein